MKKEKCKLCKKFIPVSELYADEGRFMCRNCNTERIRKYRKTKKGKDTYKRIMNEQYQRHTKKVLCRGKLYRAVKTGKVKKDSSCSYCGEIKKLEAHHNDYNKPLDVIWVCRGCHNNIENLLKNKKSK